jgi:hypothetical protein
MQGVLPWLVRWCRSAGTKDFYPALAALISPVQKIIFLAAHFFTLLVSIAQQPGQAVVLGRLSLCLLAPLSHIHSSTLKTTSPLILHLLINTHNHIMMLRSPFCDFVPSPRSLPLVSDASSLPPIPSETSNMLRILAVESSTTSTSTKKTKG